MSELSNLEEEDADSLEAAAMFHPSLICNTFKKLEKRLEEGAPMNTLSSICG